MAKIKTIQEPILDSTGKKIIGSQKVYPRTKETAVFDNAGTRLDAKLSGFTNPNILKKSEFFDFDDSMTAWDIQVGFDASATTDESLSNYSASIVDADEVPGALKGLKVSVTANSEDVRFVQQIPNSKAYKAYPLTLSVYAKSDIDGATIILKYNDGAATKTEAIALTNEFVRYALPIGTTRVNNNEDTVTIMINTNGVEGSVTIAAPKLELGTACTPYIINF